MKTVRQPAPLAEIVSAARGAGEIIGLVPTMGALHEGHLSLVRQARRECGLGAFVDPTGNVVADMDRVRAFYRDVRGRHPELECVPRLREEDEEKGLAAG